jgi:hypothetical protein
VVIDRALICVADIPAAAAAAAAGGGVCDSTVIICPRYGQVVANAMRYNM